MNSHDARIARLKSIFLVTAQVDSRSQPAKNAMNSFGFAFPIIRIAFASIWERGPFRLARKRVLP